MGGHGDRPLRPPLGWIERRVETAGLAREWIAVQLPGFLDSASLILYPVTEPVLCRQLNDDAHQRDDRDTEY
jgi:hypothetical protein